MVFNNLFFRPLPMAINISGVLDALVEWASTFVVQAMDGVSNVFLELLGMDMTVFISYFPFTAYTFPILQNTAWILLFFIVAWQLFRNFFGPLTDAEKPMTLIGRSVISAFLIGWALPICDILLKFASESYDQLLNFTATSSMFATEEFSWDGVANSITDTFQDVILSAGVTSLVSLIIVIALAWNYLKLLLEVVERYIVLGVLTYTSPFGFMLAGSQSLSNSFKAWCRMFGSQLFMMLMNVWFLRSFNFSMQVFVNTGGEIDSLTINSPALLWMFCALAFLRTGQALDRHLNALGMSVAQTGIGLGQELMQTGMSLMMGARMMTMTMGRGGGMATTGGGAPTRFGRMQNRLNSGSYALDAARVNATTAMGGKGFWSQALRNNAAQNLANGTTMLTPNQIGLVANATPKQGMGNIVDGTQLGNIGSNSLKTFMPQLNGANLEGTNIGAGKITTSAIGADGNATQLSFVSASQGPRPQGAIGMTAADGSQWYMTASGSGAGAFSNAAGISPEGEAIGNRFSSAGFSPDATVQNIGDGAIRVTDANGGTSDWFSTMNHDVGDVSGQYMTADNGEVFFSQTPLTDTARYDGNPTLLTNDFSTAFEGMEITNASSVGEGQFEFYNKGNGEWYRASDANYYDQPNGSACVSDNNGNQFYVEQAESRQVRSPVYDDNGQQIVDTVRDDKAGTTTEVPRTEVKTVRNYSNIRSKRGITRK